jgi:hypothetical protein
MEVVAGAYAHAMAARLGRKSAVAIGHAQHVLRRGRTVSTVTIKEKGNKGVWTPRI